MTSAEAGYWCVVPAAGSGRRFGGETPKQYVRIAGRPLLAWTLERLASHPRIAGLVVVLASDDAHWAHLDIEAGKPILTAIGGSERADSVLAGLRALPGSVASKDPVLVHDAARPLVRHGDLDRLMAAAVASGGALLAAPLRDTLKRADAGAKVIETEPREARWRALTPQMFARGALESALIDAQRAGITVTDESMAMERMGLHPQLVEGSEDNLKITKSADLGFAEFLLVQQAQAARSG